MRFVGERESKAARFRKEPPVGRRMSGLMKKRKRNPERIGKRTFRDIVYEGVYIKGPKRIDKNRSVTRAKRQKSAHLAKNSVRINRAKTAGRQRPRLFRPATRFGWTPREEA